MDKRKKENETRDCDPVKAATNGMVTEGRGDILSDVLGSYTGTAQDGDRPEQDADDL